MKARTRTVVKTFMPKFAPLVEAGTKRNTIRKVPKRMPRVGDRFSGRQWTGRPYFSKQRILIEGVVTEVLHIQIRKLGIWFPGVRRITTPIEMLQFAKADGFETLKDFRDWFLKDKTTFKGVFIKWEPDPA